ncbi:TetR family transcriptional regulator [Lentzea sp. NBRC 105346]|uniref:TetR/AcrR family transcriptional regulator n=1 Tax=Lentzea sp. NBRC 105346 TaxID=3032205 RepID=UPI0024A2D775|nr:TetR/AcrR family transcriptional regulator C-terminal domain-containing protein [Lentzea sp. NBRC 105346]GLZ29928.1 TetR family transcriptional regulator [Lentzea sp. NBRC 105346]
MSVWFSEPKSGGGQHLGLSRELIVRTAVRMLDEEGLAKLSMRKLAGQLGAAPMSLYWHVPTKDALLELCLDELYAEIEPPDDDVEWDVACRGFLYSLRYMGLRHPWCMQLLGKYVGVGPKAVAMSEALLSKLVAAGMSHIQASRAASSMSSYVIGWTLAESNWQTEQNEFDTKPLREKYAERFPIWTSLLAEAELWSLDKQFDFGLECVIAGVKARVPIR